MNIVRNEIRGLRNIISEREHALVAERNALQKANARIAELEQRLNNFKKEKRIVKKIPLS